MLQCVWEREQTGLAGFFWSVLHAEVCTLGIRFAVTPPVLGAEFFGDESPWKPDPCSEQDLVPILPRGQGDTKPLPQDSPSFLCGAWGCEVTMRVPQQLCREGPSQP